MRVYIVSANCVRLYEGNNTVHAKSHDSMEPNHEEIAKELIIPDRQFISIEYPGFPRNVQKAIETLGGLDTIADACSVRH